MNFSLYVAKRYVLSRSKNNAINIISYLAVLGVFGSSLALFVVLSAFGGLKEFSLSFANTHDPDLKVLPIDSKRLIINENNIKQLYDIEGVQNVSKVIEEKVLLSFKNKNSLAILKAVDGNFNAVNDIRSTVIAGNWLNLSQPYEVVIGNGISRQLSLGILDQSAYLSLKVPKPGKGQILNPQSAFRSTPTSVRGIYNISEDYNNTYIFGQLPLAKELLNYDDQEYSAIEMSLSENSDIENIKKQILNVFNQEIEVKTRLQLNDELYKMLNTENLMVYLISTLVLIIALFNLVGAVIMAILDKRQNIKTLSHLGASQSQINTIFFFQGFITAAVGSFFGILIGAFIVYLQLKFELFYITSSLPYPVKFSIETLFLVLFTTLGLGVIASKIASTRANRIA